MTLAPIRSVNVKSRPHKLGYLKQLPFTWITPRNPSSLKALRFPDKGDHSEYNDRDCHMLSKMPPSKHCALDLEGLQKLVCQWRARYPRMCVMSACFESPESWRADCSSSYSPPHPCSRLQPSLDDNRHTGRARQVRHRLSRSAWPFLFRARVGRVVLALTLLEQIHLFPLESAEAVLVAA